MEATELRIGNEVLFASDGTVFTVVEIMKEGLRVKTEDEDTWIEIDQFEGIPLTEEILLRCGFTCIHKENKHYSINDPNGFKDSYKISIFLTFNEQWHIAFSDTLSGYRDYIPTTKIKYLHQLQNLFFALTNSELTINPISKTTNPVN